MNDFTAAVIGGWDVQPFSGGMEGLRALEASSFTGVVRLGESIEEGAPFDGPTGSNGDTDAVEREFGAADPGSAGIDTIDSAGTENADRFESSGDDPSSESASPRRPWLAMVEGTVRGVFDGALDDFDDASGTAYAAPAGAPVLLRAMIERAGETRGDLHTDERLSAVESDLPDGFSGYVELIGNGLDGAYYVVYDEGRVSPVVVHEEDDLTARIDPDEFDRAAERASVYEVRAVSLDPVPLPGPDPEPDPATQADPTIQPDSDSHPDSPDRPANAEAGAVMGPGTAATDAAVSPFDGAGGRPDVDTAEADADGATVAELRAERDRLRAAVERLEAALDAYRSGTSRGPGVDADGGIDTGERSAQGSHNDRDTDDWAGGDGTGDASANPSTAVAGDSAPDTERSAEEALAETTLLVRYASQGAPTLARVGEGTDPDAVRANLRIAPHTDFDAADTVVSGTGFDDFLRSTIEYRFVEWVLGDLFFEIRDTGNEQSLGAFSEAIPAIDRVDLRGTVDVEYVAGGETERSTEAFDVVFRDRMSEPLLVARLDETRSQAPVERVTDLLTAANRVGETVNDLAGAIAVSGGYFEPEALRTADEVTDGGFLSRDARKSFVKRSRRRGYHLCLVEAMGENFHLSVPEL